MRPPDGYPPKHLVFVEMRGDAVTALRRGFSHVGRQAVLC